MSGVHFGGLCSANVAAGAALQRVVVRSRPDATPRVPGANESKQFSISDKVGQVSAQ